MDFNLGLLDPGERYRLLNNLVIPRPIAWITSLNKAGIVNAAPFSWFNLMGVDPPIITIGPQYRYNFKKGIKDTPQNIWTGRTFVINIVNEKLAEKMYRTSGFYPADVSEAEELNLPLAPSEIIGVPRIAEAPASIECREYDTIFIGNTCIIIGEALHLWINDQLIDPERLHINFEAIRIIGKGGGSKYVRTDDVFDLKQED